jgi:hypothetical protein
MPTKKHSTTFRKTQKISGGNKQATLKYKGKVDNGTYTGNVFRVGDGEQRFNDSRVFKGEWRGDKPWWGEMTIPGVGRFEGAFKDFKPYYGPMFDLDKSVKTPLYHLYYGKKKRNPVGSPPFNPEDYEREHVPDWPTQYDYITKKDWAHNNGRDHFEKMRREGYSPENWDSTPPRDSLMGLNPSTASYATSEK